MQVVFSSWTNGMLPSMFVRMIFDLLANTAYYEAFSPRLKRAFDFLKQTDLEALSAGKHMISGEEIFASVDEYESKQKSDCKWEAHRKYLDIQVLIHGCEKIGVSLLRDGGSMKAKGDYNPEKDVQFFSGEGDEITIRPGMFAVFFPEDVHMPKIACEGPEKIKKIVVKVLLA